MTRNALDALMAVILDDAAPAGSIIPSQDLQIRILQNDYIDQQFNSIPAGPPGPIGPAGLEWQGAWSPGVTYALNDAVGYNGASYFNILGITGNAANTNPVTDTTHWALLAMRGADGVQGVPGPPGDPGLPGSGGVSAVYKATLTQSNGGGITAIIHKNTLGSDVEYTTQAQPGNFGISISDFEQSYSASISNYSATKNVKLQSCVINAFGAFRQTDLQGTPVANFNDVYIEIYPL